ncbi:hypothetical protein D3C80_1923080 [compost metagenome]
MELPPKSFSSAIAVSTGTMPSGALLLSGPVEILTIPTVPVGDTNPFTTESFCPSSARLVATPVNT